MPQQAQVPHLFPAGAQPGTHNVVLYARSRRHRVGSFTGPLSIKTVLNGRVAWIVAGRELYVDPSSFLILNAGETYSMEIDAPCAVETCCVFFAPGFVERVVLDATSPLHQAIDSPDRHPPGVPYLSALHTDEQRDFIHPIHTLAPRCRTALAPSGFEEDFLLAATRLLRLYRQIGEQSARLPAVRAATREELFRRLLIGREYLHSHSSEPVSLAAAARAACLSPFHFHRGFTQAFAQTPHAYLTALRLVQARRSIESGSPVIDACVEVGFSSPSAFTRLFRSHFGRPPSAFRRKLPAG